MTRRNRNTVSAAATTTRAIRPAVRRRGAEVLRSATAGAIEQLEQRQMLSATIAVNSSLMVYNAVNGQTSPAETLTITNTGDAALTLGPSAFTLAGTSPGQFAVTNAGSAPASLAAGQSFGLQLTYSPNIVGRQTATLDVASNDPAHGTLAVGLSGIGTSGRGGTDQPSLARILRAYGIPTIVGEGPNDSNEASDAIYPNPPDASSQEVSLQRLVKAGSGPVTIQVLASFTADAAEPYTLGWYTAGSPSAKTELFYTPTSESQSVYVQPQGSTSFDPGGTAFGMYFVSNIQDNGTNRIGYSEDKLNTWDTTVNRKFRFFPMENADGTPVANTYVMTSTEWDAPIGYDFTNIVAIISNVTAAPGAPAGPSLTVTNPDALPGTSNVVFNSIWFYNSSIGDTVHQNNTLTLTNTGSAPLTITALNISNTDEFHVTAGPSLPVTLQPGVSTNVTVKMYNNPIPSSPYNETVGTDPGSQANGGVDSATLTIVSNDPASPSKVLPLTGYVQYQSENSTEPSLQTIVNLVAGYGTNINSTPIPVLPEDQSTSNSSPTYYGEETVSAYWTAADSSRPVSVIDLAAYHTQGDNVQLKYTSVGGTSGTQILEQASDDGQSMLPLNPNGGLAAGSFTSGGTFGFLVTGSGPTEYSDDSLNFIQTGGGHHWRFYPARTAAGDLIPNTYLVAIDYGLTPEENFDFQDDVFLMSNIRPASNAGQAPAAPTDLTAHGVAGTAAGVQLTWAPSLTAGVTGYNVYRKNSDGTYALLTSSPTTAAAYLDTAADKYSANTYRVTAVGPGGAGAATESLASAASSTAAARPGPVVQNFTYSVAAGGTLSFNALAGATDQDPAATLVASSLAVSSAPNHGGSAVANSPGAGYITYTASASYAGTETFQYTVTDSNGTTSAAGLVTVTVTAVTTTPTPTTPTPTTPTPTTPTPTTPTPTTPTPTTPTPTTPTPTTVPTANTFVGRTLANTAVTLDVLSALTSSGTIDRTGTTSPLALVPNAGPSRGSVTLNADGTITYTPSKDDVGGDEFQYTVTDVNGGTSAPITVDVNVGIRIGSTATYRTLRYTDGTTNAAVTVTLNKGLADVYFDGTGVQVTPTAKGSTVVQASGNGLSIRTVVLSGTTAASVLSLTAAGPVHLGGLVDADPIGTVNARTSNLLTDSGTVGSAVPVLGNAYPSGYLGLTGGVKVLSLATATDADLVLGGTTASTVTFVGAVTDSALASTAPLTRLSATQWTATAGSSQPGAITAPSIAALAVRGEFDSLMSLSGGTGQAATLGTASVGSVAQGAWSVAGNARSVVITGASSGFAGLTVSGTLTTLNVGGAGGLAGDVTAGSIGTMRVAGPLTGDVHTTGNLNVLNVGSLSGNTVAVGTTTGLTDTTAATIGTATLGTLTVTGKGANPVFSDAAVIAHTIRSASTGRINASAGHPEGIVASSITTAAVGVNNATVRLNRAALASDTALSDYLHAKGLSFGDASSFRIDIV